MEAKRWLGLRHEEPSFTSIGEAFASGGEAFALAGQNGILETPEVYLGLGDLGSTETPDFEGDEDPMQNVQPPQEFVPQSHPPQDPVPISESGLPAWIIVGIQYSPDDL
ncbi:hypothetical protein R1flu_011751 [Riccia fluitans]|uniref:Uncharacterized protein n=1 Tax=Riccia fluitans TaxID=41844 RepID=A0ABD1ZB90_9MARC